jgi:hypothetical protein
MHWGRSSCLSLKGYYWTFSIQGEINKMVPSRVDSNKKWAKYSIGRVEEELFWFDRMRTTVSGPCQSTVHLADKTPRYLYYECLDEGEARQFPTPNLYNKIDMQARYAATRATVLKYTLPVPISKKTSSQYIAILMRILMVHLHHPRGQMRLRWK